MQITRVSTISGRTHVREIAVTEAQLDAWAGGELIQYAMPELSADDREFIMSGNTPEEWDQLFGFDDDRFDDAEYDACMSLLADVDAELPPHPDDIMIWPCGTMATREDIDRGDYSHKSDDYRRATDEEAFHY